MVTTSPRLSAMLCGLPVALERIVALLLCWQLAGLFWLLAGPSTADINLALPRQSANQSVVSRDALLRWYGADGEAAAPIRGEYSLMAVIAGRNGVALLKSGQASVAVRVGDEIRPGTRLVAVDANQITIEQDGVREELKFAPSALSAASLLARVEPNLKAERSVPPIKLTRGQMAGVLQGGNLGSWDKGLAAAPDGGIRVENAASQPLARLLQLKSGDILKMINRRPLDRLADISLVFHFFGQSAPVDLVLVRDGASLTQHYEIQP